MPWRESDVVAGTPPDSTETVIAAIAPGAIPGGLTSSPTALTAEADITAGADTTGVTLKLYRGVDKTGTLVATVGPIAVAAAARANVTVLAKSSETNVGWVVTATMVAASAAATINQVALRATW